MDNNQEDLNQNKARLAIQASEKKKINRRDFFHSPKGVLEVTDMRFADYFINLNKGEINYNRNNKEWLVWNKPAWTNDESLFYDRYKICINSLYQFAKKIKNYDTKKSFEKSIVKFQGLRKMYDMLGHALKDKAVNKSDDLFDNQPGFFNCRNKVVNLTQTEFRILEHDPEMLICKQSGYEYDQSAKCPKFLAIMNTIFDGNDQLINFIQRALGYCLTGYTNEQCFFFMYGTGSNGKSTFAEILRLIFGEYFHKANIDIILEQKSQSINNDVAALKGKRLVIASELSSGKRLNESLIKDLTGGDPKTARYLYKEFFTFMPECKIWIYGNHKPIIKGIDEGIKRRLKIIPFIKMIPEEMKRPMNEILEEMKSELPGILSWVLEGYNQWRKDNKLVFPDEVVSTTKEYFEDADKVQIFLDNCCTFNSSNMVSVKELHEKYLNFCSSNGDKPLGKRTFESQLKEKNLKLERKTNNRCYWMGVDVKKGD